MIYQPHLEFGHDVVSIPQPRTLIRRLMLAASAAVDGPVDINPERFDERLGNCLYMGQAGLIILGTACQRPLMLREAENVGAAAQLDVLVVRSAEGSERASFDLVKAGDHRPLCAYRMWMPRPSEGAWLIPSVTISSPFVRLTPFGLEFHERPPFADRGERDLGLVLGAQYLGVAAQGWF